MRGTLMRMLTKEQHIELLSTHSSNVTAAKVYSKLMGKKITRQNVKYWRYIFITNDGNMAAADRGLKALRVLRRPSPDDDIGILPNFDKVYNTIMVIPDQHAPYNHKDMIAFLAAVKEKYQPEVTVNLGDELDMHAMSFHDSDPNLDSAGPELENGKVVMEQLHKLFPEMLVCASNHGSMAYRKAKAHGLPVQFIRRYRDVIFPGHGAPGWSWAYEWVLNTPLGEVLFKHQSSGILADAAHHRCNLMVGHSHGNFSVEYCASSEYLYWGAYGGCLIDKDSMAFAYGKNTKNKPIVGCVVILDGLPVHIPMRLNRDGRWIKRI